MTSLGLGTVLQRPSTCNSVPAHIVSARTLRRSTCKVQPCAALVTDTPRPKSVGTSNGNGKIGQNGPTIIDGQVCFLILTSPQSVYRCIFVINRPFHIELANVVRSNIQFLVIILYNWWCLLFFKCRCSTAFLRTSWTCCAQWTSTWSQQCCLSSKM